MYDIWSEPIRDEVILDKVLFKLKKVKKILKGSCFNLSVQKKEKHELLEEMVDLETLEVVSTLNHYQ
jgi:hypothetical protein